MANLIDRPLTSFRNIFKFDYHSVVSLLPIRSHYMSLLKVANYLAILILYLGIIRLTWSHEPKVSLLIRYDPNFLIEMTIGV